MKPLKGVDQGLFENLASFCTQDYPSFQLLFCVNNASDPALRVIERLKTEFPSADIETVVSDKVIGCNPKINNLSNAYPSARHGLIMIADSDVRVTPDFLRRSVAPLDDPKVGLVTFFYQSAPGRGLWSSLEALAVNAQFLPQTVTAAAFGMDFAMGAAILVRREVFEGAGGFPSLADHLADDFVLGNLVMASGHRLAYAGGLVSVIPDIGAPSELMRHQIRESRTVRLCQPAGYCGSLILHGFSLLTLKALILGPDPLTLSLLAALWTLKAAAANGIVRLLDGETLPLWTMLLIPLSEWLATASFIGGLGSNQILWRGVVYSVQANGSLVPVRRSLDVLPTAAAK